MKISKYASKIKGKEGTIKTSGGGNFEGYIGNYDKESNTIDVWNGFSRTKIDADKIVSYNARPPLAALLIIAAFVGGCFLLLDIVKDPRNNRHDRYDRYERSYYR